MGSPTLPQPRLRLPRRAIHDKSDVRPLRNPTRVEERSPVGQPDHQPRRARPGPRRAPTVMQAETDTMAVGRDKTTAVHRHSHRLPHALDATVGPDGHHTCAPATRRHRPRNDADAQTSSLQPDGKIPQQRTTRSRDGHRPTRRTPRYIQQQGTDPDREGRRPATLRTTTYIARRLGQARHGGQEAADAVPRHPDRTSLRTLADLQGGDGVRTAASSSQRKCTTSTTPTRTTSPRTSYEND